MIIIDYFKKLKLIFKFNNMLYDSTMSINKYKFKYYS